MDKKESDKMKTKYMYQLKANFDSDEDADYGLFKNRKDAKNEIEELISDIRGNTGFQTRKDLRRLFWIEKLKVQ